MDAYNRALAIRQTLFARDPANREGARGLLAIHRGLSRVHEQLGNRAEAERHRLAWEQIRRQLRL